MGKLNESIDKLNEAINELGELLTSCRMMDGMGKG